MNQLPTHPTKSSAYYPSRLEINAMMRQFETPKLKEAIKPGFIARTDGFNVDEIVASLEQRPGTDALLSRLLSVSDLTTLTYKRFSDNPNSLMNWIRPLEAANAKADAPFAMPATKVLRLPIELAQFIRIEYAETSQRDRALFNDWIFDQFGLEDDKTYFIKTGTFSSKFQFANAKCAEPREMGEYFQVVNNFAMELGAGHTVDLVVREYIEDTENNPTIYNGMPLRTEFRAFIDCDTDTVLGVVPYWHPIVMKRVLGAGLVDSIQQDFETYAAHEDKLTREFNEQVAGVTRRLERLVPHLDLAGKWSIDIMKTGDEFYAIDMATMQSSALTELL